jgi:hypothetical protein
MVRYNAATRMFLPCIGLSKEKLEKAGLINTYMEWEGDEIKREEPTIYLLFNSLYPEALGELITIMDKRELIVDEWDENERVIIALRVPKMFHPDYRVFITGKYSRYSDAMKAMFNDKPSKDEKVLKWPKSMEWLIFDRHPIMKNFIIKKYGLDDDDLGPEDEVFPFDYDKLILKLEAING